jgi:hypothetical protein
MAIQLPGIPIPAFSLAGPWLALAFALGSLPTRRMTAVLVGALGLVGGLSGYYGYMRLAEYASPAYLAPEVVLWLPIAVVSGSIFGYLGAAWRRDGDRARVVAVTLSAGALAVEAVTHLAGSGNDWLLVHTPELESAYYIELLAALALPLMLMTKWPQRVACYTAIVAVAGLALTCASIVPRAFAAF